jgi:hypothetical protein
MRRANARSDMITHDLCLMNVTIKASFVNVNLKSGCSVVIPSGDNRAIALQYHFNSIAGPPKVANPSLRKGKNSSPMVGLSIKNNASLGIPSMHPSHEEQFTLDQSARGVSYKPWVRYFGDRRSRIQVDTSCVAKNGNYNNYRNK